MSKDEHLAECRKLLDGIAGVVTMLHKTGAELEASVATLRDAIEDDAANDLLSDAAMVNTRKSLHTYAGLFGRIADGIAAAYDPTIKAVNRTSDN